MLISDHYLQRPIASELPAQDPPAALGPPPLPMAGANTYFGDLGPAASVPTPTPAPVAAPAPPIFPAFVFPASNPTQTPATPSTQSDKPKTAQPVSQGSPFKGGNLFSQPQNQVKDRFEQHLVTRLESVQQSGLPRIGGDPTGIARNVTELIHGIRKNKSLGFLHDDQHWRLLNEALKNDRFVLAVAAGYITPKFIALANREDLEARISAINDISEAEFADQLGTRTDNPDPLV